MVTVTENDLSALLLENTTLRSVEASIYSVLPCNESGNEYDTRFGFVYDLIACNPIYNRLIWGYSVKIFPQVANDALRSTPEGNVLDLGCKIRNNRQYVVDPVRKITKNRGASGIIRPRERWLRYAARPLAWSGLP